MRVNCLPLCILGCNQQHVLCGLLCFSDWFFFWVVNGGKGRKKRVSFPASCVASLASMLEEPNCGFGALLGALVLFTSAPLYTPHPL